MKHEEPETKPTNAGSVRVDAPVRRDDWRKDMGWQPIETVPKDGTEIIMFSPTARAIDETTIAKWDQERRRWIKRYFSGMADPWAWNATHWMPLPGPPAA